MKTEREVREMLKRYEGMQERNEKRWLDSHISYEYYLRKDDKYSGIIDALKMVLS